MRSHIASVLGVLLVLSAVMGSVNAQIINQAATGNNIQALQIDGTPAPGDSISFTVGAPPGACVTFIGGTAQGNVPLVNGLELLIDPASIYGVSSVTAPASGVVQVVSHLPNDLLESQFLIFQACVVTPSALDLTNASTVLTVAEAPAAPALALPTVQQPASPTNAATTMISGAAAHPGDTIQLSLAGVVTTVVADGGPLGNAFSVALGLTPNSVNTVYVTEVFADGSQSPPVSVAVVQDQTPPTVFIDFPVDGDVLSPTDTPVFGRVGDALSGSAGISVTVNGVAAQVDVRGGANGTFELDSLALNLDAQTTITVVATDLLGNASTEVVSVTQQAPPPGSSTLEILSGNDQVAEVSTSLPQPIAVRVLAADGSAFANKLVTFDITRSDGLLSTTPGGSGSTSIQVLTDAMGEAAAFWQLGSDAGVANNRVEVTSGNVVGTAIFCASGLPRPASQINVGTGNSQRAQIGSPLPLPLEVRVTDGLNPIANVPVTFTVRRGLGNMGGQSAVTVVTDAVGKAEAALTLGGEAGENVVEANFPGNPGLPAVFRAIGVAANMQASTRFTGTVLDNAQRPIGGAVCHLHINGTDFGPVLTDTFGAFIFDNLPSGAGELSVDATNATTLDGISIAPGTFPSLHFDGFVVVENSDNSLPTPVFLPPLDPANAQPYDGTSDVVLTVNGIEGFRMVIEAGSMTLADGSTPDPASPAIVSLNMVHADEVPMPLPDGVANPIIWTLQPSGAHFDPPVRVELPNTTGLAPGAVTDLISFNHSTGRFEVIGTSIVSADGSLIVSEPGSGIAISGWGAPAPPPPPPGETENCAGIDYWALARDAAKLAADVLIAIGDIQGAIACFNSVTNATVACENAWNTAMADGMLTQAEIAAVLGCVNSVKGAILSCVDVLPRPDNFVRRAQQIQAVIGSAIAAAQGQSQCLSVGLNVALSAASTLNNVIGVLLNYVGEVNLKQLAGFAACQTLELIIGALNIHQAGMGLAEGDPIGNIDTLFAALATEVTDFTTVGAGINDVVNPQFTTDVMGMESDFTTSADLLETNPELAGATVTVAGRTVVANAGGGFSIDNIPSGTGLIAATVTKQDANGTSYGRSTFFEIGPGQTVVNENLITLGPTPPTAPISLAFATPGAILLVPGVTAQLSINGNMSDGSTADLTMRSSGSSYVSSNNGVVSVGQDGLVTSHATGTAFVTVMNQGASAVKQVIVSDVTVNTTIQGFVQLEDGTRVDGAMVTLTGTGLTATTNIDGFFDFGLLTLPPGNVVVTAQATIMSEMFNGAAAGVEIVSNGITEAGIITISAAKVVGYYDMSLNQGSSNQVAPINTAGLIPMNVGDMNTADLTQIDILFVQNPDNFAYSANYTLNLLTIENWVTNGGVLIFHDRFVDAAETVLPGCPGMIIRQTSGPSAADINIVDNGTRLTNGPGGIVTDSNLDGGNLSSHGFAVEGTIPPSGRGILSRTNATELVTYSYRVGAGWVIFSSIPLDFYLGGTAPIAIGSVYAPNVLAYGQDLANGVHDND